MALTPHFDYQTFGSQIFWLFITFSLFYIFIIKIFIPKLNKVVKHRDDCLNVLNDNLTSSIEEKNELEKVYETAINKKLKEINEVLDKDNLAEKKKNDAMYLELVAELYSYMENVDQDLMNDFQTNKSNYDYLCCLITNFSSSLLNKPNDLK